MKKVVNLVANYFTQLIGSSISFIFILLSSNLLSPFEFGELRTAITISSFILVFTLPGFDQYILKNAKSLNLSDVFSIVVFRVKIGLFALIFMQLLLFSLFDQLSRELVLYLRVIVFFLPMMDLAGGFRSYFIGIGLHKQAIGYFGMYRILNLLFFALGILLHYILKFNILILIFFYSSSIIAFLLLLITIAKKKNILITDCFFTRVDYRSALLLTISGLFFTISFMMDKLLIRNIFGPKQFALYSVLFLIPNESLRLVDLSFPFFYRNLDKIRIKWQYLMLSLLFLLVYVLIFSKYSSFVFGPEYFFDTKLVLISTLFLVGGSFEYYYYHLLYCKKGKRGQLYAYVINFVLLILLCSLPIFINSIDFKFFILLFPCKQLVLILILYYYDKYFN